MKSLNGLIKELDHKVRQSNDPTEIVPAVESALKKALQCPDLLNDHWRKSGSDRYQQHLLHVAADGRFSVVSLVWEPGQSTPLHNHRAWCVVGVYEGEELETRYELIRKYGKQVLRQSGSWTRKRGDTTWLVPPADIHRVENSSHGTTVSIHVYGADLRKFKSSINCEYELSGRQVKDSKSVENGQNPGKTRCAGHYAFGSVKNL